jgi:hypothetical protein
MSPDDPGQAGADRNNDQIVLFELRRAETNEAALRDEEVPFAILGVVEVVLWIGFIGSIARCQPVRKRKVSAYGAQFADITTGAVKNDDR